MTLLVDTSVWSLALRRDSASNEPEVEALKDALEGGDLVITTGLVLQELLQCFSGPKAHAQIVERFAALRWCRLTARTTLPQQESATSADEPVCRSAPSTLCWRS